MTMDHLCNVCANLIYNHQHRVQVSTGWVHYRCYPTQRKVEFMQGQIERAHTALLQAQHKFSPDSLAYEDIRRARDILKEQPDVE